VTESPVAAPTCSGEALALPNERVELEMKIIKYRLLVRGAVNDPVKTEPIAGLIVNLEQKLREIDE
jgi:hypothetical protein